MGVTALKPLVAEHADREEDWRIRLEACASLARLDPETWTARVVDAAVSGSSTPEARMEAVFALSEIPTDEAAEALASIAAHPDQPHEPRSAAVWGLGRGTRPRGDLLLPFMADADDRVALHAIVALDQLPDQIVPQLQAWLASGDNRKAAAARHILMRHQQVRALLDAAKAADDGRLWAVGALGELDPVLVAEAAGRELDPQLRELLEPMWRGHLDWLREGDGRDGLEALDVQTVRFDPVDLSD